jgi:zona occludens toxin
VIELRTGIPGSGKTLSAVQELAKLQKKWEANPEQLRPVFVHGIADLALNHAVVPLQQVASRDGSKTFVPDWDAMPDGSLVLVDEAQGLFPPRSSQSKPPEHVAWLNTHRHKGFDIWITTQHPKLIDGAVRALVGKHLHYRRLFGGQRAAVYEFDGCNDSLNGLSSGVISYWPYPKRVFDWYKSAELHTKQKFKLPRFLLVPLAGIVLGIFTMPTAIATLSNGMSGKGIKGELPVIGSAPVAPVLSGATAAGGAVGAVAPAADRTAYVSPSKIPVTPFTRPVVLASACLASATKCKCYNRQGVHVVIPDSECRAAADHPINFVPDPEPV